MNDVTLGFSMRVVWVGGMEWRLILPDGRYVPFSSLKALETHCQNGSVSRLIGQGIENLEISLKGWREQK